MLLDGKRKVISIPEEKIVKTVNQLLLMLDKKKATVKELQSLTGLLNFLTRAIFPERAFTRRMYSKFLGAIHTMKSYHHVKLDMEFKADCWVWLAFLDNDINNIYRISRPFMDLSKFTTANDIGFSSDATAGKFLGFGCVFGKSWLFGQWEPDFIDHYSPSIEVLELFALCLGLFTWIKKIANSRVLVYCDNQAVVSMVNSTSSSCAYCMKLIRRLTLKCLQWNVRVFARHLKGSLNILPDRLSRLKISEFKKLVKDKGFDQNPTNPDMELWPLSSVLDQEY